MAVFNLVENSEGRKSIFVVVDGAPLLASEPHPRFDEIVARVLADDLDGLAELFSPAEAIQKQFAGLSADVRIDDGQVFYRGEIMAGALVDQILNRFDAGEEYGSFVKFLERLQSNPNPHSVEHLYRWISDRHLTLTSDGRIVGYKGLLRDGTSVHAGPGIRNGEAVNGHIPNEPGDTIEMAREDVTFDSSIGCSVGLHVGTWEYARGFGSLVRKVYVDPADVVSVPTDCEDEKMRVCRYTVGEDVAEKDSAWTEYVEDDGLDDPVDDWDEDEDESEDWWAEPEESEDDATKVFSIFFNTKVDTTKNHLSQKRGPNGQFIKG